MYTTSFVDNIHCMFLTRGGGSCIPQVLFTISSVYSDQGWWFMYTTSFVYKISGVCSYQRWWFMYSTSFVYNIRCML